MTAVRAALYLNGRTGASLAAAALAGASKVGPLPGHQCPLVLVNPGSGPLAQKLLQMVPPPSRLLLFEPDVQHEPHLQQLRTQYPSQLDYHIGDFFGMWKLAYQDKMDSGSRIQTLLKDITPQPWGKDVSMKVMGAIPSLDFIKHLINSIIFQNSLISYGRPEFYLSMLPLDYYTIVPDNPDSIALKFIYRPTPVLFNILFDQKILTKLPREDFTPQKVITSGTVRNKTRTKLANLDKESLYFVHITPKEKLPCRVEHLPLLWYFFKHHLISKTNRIIPMLEQWIPGCGVWLITGQDPPGTNVEIGPDENDTGLPHITIFTQFSDLNSQQKLTLFKKFISWPEFEQSPFRETLDNHIYKTLSTSDEIKIENTDMNLDEETKVQAESK